MILYLRRGETLKTEYAEKYKMLGLKIAYFRKKAGYTQEMLSNKIGRSTNFLAQVEGTGTIKGISLETLFKIADILQIPAAKILEDDWCFIQYDDKNKFYYASKYGV